MPIDIEARQITRKPSCDPQPRVMSDADKQFLLATKLGLILIGLIIFAFSCGLIIYLAAQPNPHRPTGQDPQSEAR
jgi:hypothetical protein